MIGCNCFQLSMFFNRNTPPAWRRETRRNPTIVQIYIVFNCNLNNLLFTCFREPFYCAIVI